MDSLTTMAGLVFAGLTAAVIGFQLALAGGAPWGSFAMGGTYPGRYPGRMRVAAVAQAGLLALLAVVVLSQAGLLAPALTETLPWLIWLAVAFSAVSLVLNIITPSHGERMIWVPIAVLMVVTSLAVAVGI